MPNAAVELLRRDFPSRSDRPYLRTDERTWTYAEVAAASDAAGAGLLDLGLEPGDRVLFVLGDTPEFVFTFWGAIAAGLVPVPVPPRTDDDRVRFFRLDSHARAIVCDAASASSVASGSDGSDVARLVTGAAAPDGFRSWTEVCGAGGVLTPAAMTGDDIALWLYTSGTTGDPKAAMHTHRGIAAAPAGVSTIVYGIEPDDVIFSGSKMCFTFGLCTTVILPTWAGASSVVTGAPAVPAFVRELFDRHRPTIVSGVPALYSGLLDLGADAVPSSVRLARSGGDKLPVELYERFMERYGVELLDGLGATEALYVTCNRPGEVVPGSLGRAIEPVELQVRGEEGGVVDRGPGELLVRGPSTFAGYHGDADLTARAYDGEWLRTGDIVRIEAGFVFHEGRMADVLRVGGIWIKPSEIEDVLRAHPDVRDAAVVTTDGRYGVPEVQAFLVASRDDHELRAELARSCRKHLSAPKVPSAFEVVSELPRTGSGKLDRAALRQR